MAKSYLKGAGIVNIVLGSIFILSFIGIIIGVPLLVNGVMFLEYSKLDDEKLKTKKGSILAWSIVLLFLNLITAILSFVAYDNIEKEPKKVDPETKKLDLLLKFGVLLVVISGIIFATTSWNVIPNVVKTISLLVFSILFFILYIISAKNIKIKSTMVSYYVLGCVFVIFSYFSLLFFGIGNLDFNKITVSGLFLITSVFSILVSKKFDLSWFLHIGFISFVISLFLLLANYLSIGFVICILLLISLMCGLFIKNDLRIDFDIVLYGLSFYSFFMIIFEKIQHIEIILLTVIIIMGLFLKTYIARKTICNVFFLILSYLLVISNLGVIADNPISIISLSGALMSINLLELSLDLNDGASATSMIISDFILLMIYFTQIGSTSCLFLNLLISIFMFIPSLMSRLLNKNKELNIFLEPVLIALLVEGIRYCLSTYINIYTSDFAFIAPLVLALISLFKSDTGKKIYYAIIYLIVLFGLADVIILPILIYILISIVLYIRDYINKENTNIISYIFMLLITFIGLSYIGTNYNILVATSLIEVGLFILYSILTDNKVLKNITLFSMCIPYVDLRDGLSFDENIVFVLDYSFIIYYVLVIASLIKNNIAKRNFIFISFCLITLSLVFSENITSGVIAGILSLICIYIGFFKKDYDLLYKAGMIFGIVNIIYKLKDLWSEVPFWAYLLFAGLTIIIFVTYKQIKQNRK